MTCQRCERALTSKERVSYGAVCEDCWCRNHGRDTGPAPLTLLGRPCGLLPKDVPLRSWGLKAKGR